MKLLIISLILVLIGCSSTDNRKNLHANNPEVNRDPAAVSDYPMFDRGPDLEDEMQAELLEIIKDMPYVPGISEQLQVLAPVYKRGQKMRPDFGAMPMRGFAIPNSISVLVIGQDGTHIAEGANRPGIAGFGGRVHDMLMHLGVYEGVVFTNLFVNTISGQYGSRNTPVLVNDKEITYTNVIENRLWLLTHEGAYGKWRNRFISWVIRNNKDSLKMVMMLGQAGKDAGANFINSIGGEVGARSNVGDGSKYNLPQFMMVGAGGNNEWAVPVTQDGEDVAEVLRQMPDARKTVVKALANLKAQLNETKDLKAAKSLKAKIEKYEIAVKGLDKKIDYKGPQRGVSVGQITAEIIMKENVEAAKALMIFSQSGPQRNGVLHPQQFGGWDLRSMKVKGKKTRSIKGLAIPCHGSRVGECVNKASVNAPNIVFVGSPHPTSLSMNSATAAGKVEKELLKPLRDEIKKGWEAPAPEAGLKSAFLEGKPYRYGRGIIPPSHGDPGITDLRLLPVSTAKRSGKSTIVIGTRGQANFSKSKLKQMEKAMPSDKSLVSSHAVLTGRPNIDSTYKKYDRGPNEELSKILFETLKKDSVLWVKSKYSTEAEVLYKKELQKQNKTSSALSRAEKREITYSKVVGKMFDKYGVEAFNFKVHPNAGFFGHYRGSFDSPKVVILSDSIGYDSFITSKAATGERGQYLNGLMYDLGIGSNYLVINTIPVPMDGASDEEWTAMLDSTKEYRDRLFKVLKKINTTFIADGNYAARELKRLVGDNSFLTINQGEDYSKDMINAAKTFGDTLNGVAKGQMRDIPREHLTWIARVWEGTSGDRVITSIESDKENFGKAFAIIAPNWARKNTVYFTDETKDDLRKSWDLLATSGDPMPGEDLSDFVKRRKNCASLTEKRTFKSKKSWCLNSVPEIEFPSER